MTSWETISFSKTTFNPWSYSYLTYSNPICLQSCLFLLNGFAVMLRQILRHFCVACSRISTLQALVRTENTKIFLRKEKHLGRDMARVANLRPLTTEARFAPGSFRVRFVMDKVALGQDYLRVLRFSPSISFHRGSILVLHLQYAL
jgi:hypothetical protein